MGNGISFSFSFDDHLFVGVIVMLVIFAGLGITACVLGIIMLARAKALRPRWNHELRWQLISWGVVPWWASAPDIELDVRRTSRRLGAYAAIGAGAGIFTAVAAMATGSLMATGDLLDLPALSILLVDGVVYFGILVGYATGYTLGIWQLKRAADRLAYTDLRQRRLADYRGAALFWLPAATVAAEAALTALIAPNLGMSLHVELAGGEILLPGTPFVPWALPVAMVLIFLISEALLRRVARLPRLLVTADPEVARRADEMIRAQMIGAMEWLLSLTLGLLAAAQGFLLLDQVVPESLPLRHPLFLLATAALLPAFALLVSGAVALMAQGRLGGAKTGWPWRPAAAQ